MRKVSFLTLCCATIMFANAQRYVLDHYSIAISTLHTNLPFRSFSSLFSKEFHPGFELGTGFAWSAKEKHIWYQEFKVGYSYHRWVQHSAYLFTSAGYRYKLPKKFSADASIGAGYLHAIPDSKIFKLQDDGTYRQKSNMGRPQALVVLEICAGKTFRSGSTIFLKYGQRLQAPFIKSYVSILPFNMMQVGLAIPTKAKNQN